MELENNKKVNLFLAGGPKCGTTAMVSYLNSHKDVFISEPKECNFFMDDMPKMKYVTSIEGYNSLFKKFKTNHKIYCDASILYLHSEIALENIHKYNKDAKILVMLRNPMEMVYSFHSQIVYTLDESLKNFEEAWDAESSRRKGNNIPKKCRNSRLLYYSEIAKYFTQISRIYNFFPPDQVKIIFFDDFKSSNLKSYKEALSFLGIPYDGRIDFPRINDAKKAKSSIINLFVNRPPKSIKVIARRILKLVNKPRFGILEKLDKLNRIKDQREDISESLKLKIRNTYKEDVASLSKLFKRDLTHWLQ